jgi:hypothetical protein
MTTKPSGSHHHAAECGIILPHSHIDYAEISRDAEFHRFFDVFRC